MRSGVAYRCRWGGGKAAAEQPRKEVAAVARAAVAAIAAAAKQRGRIRDRQNLAMRGVFPALDSDIGHLAVVALEDRQQRPVAAVDVVAELQLAVVVDERGLIGQVDRDEGRQLDILLAAR